MKSSRGMLCRELPTSVPHASIRFTRGDQKRLVAVDAVLAPTRIQARLSSEREST
jgi:hypothetical protein